LVALEHRFYGESIPNGNLFTDNYKYLSVQQALADLATFTDYYKGIVPESKNVPWFVFGGSYPGA
jgi:serine protease 16